MTLVEILEQVIVEHNTEFNKIIKEATDHQNIAHRSVSWFDVSYQSG